jgi:hypothetical protein
LSFTSVQPVTLSTVFNVTLLPVSCAFQVQKCTPRWFRPGGRAPWSSGLERHRARLQPTRVHPGRAHRPPRKPPGPGTGRRGEHARVGQSCRGSVALEPRLRFVDEPHVTADLELAVLDPDLRLMTDCSQPMGSSSSRSDHGGRRGRRRGEPGRQAGPGLGEQRLGESDGSERETAGEDGTQRRIAGNPTPSTPNVDDRRHV